MLDWLKRRTAAAPREQLVEKENRAPSTEEKVERLVYRLGGNRNAPDEGAPASADSNEAPAPIPEVAPVPEVGLVSDAGPVPDVAPVPELASVAEIAPTPEVAT